MQKYTVAFMICWVVLAWQPRLIGQDTLFIRAVAQPTSHAMKIRWAPESHRLWQWCNEVGYKIERLTLSSASGAPLTSTGKLASAKKWAPPFQPLPPNAWEAMMDSSKVAGVAAAALYGEGFAMEDLADHSMVRIYNQVQEQENRFGLGLFAADQDWKVAEAMGLAFVDSTVVKGESYLYYISPAVFPSSFTAKPAAIVLKATNEPKLLKPEGLQAQFGDRSVQLKWNASERSEFTSYIIERSLDGGQQFTRVNPLAVVPTSQSGSSSKWTLYKDTLLENFQTVVYRIKGKSIFGELSPPSDTVSGSGKPARLDASLGIFSIQEISQGQLQLKWDFPAKWNEHLKGFEVYRSRHKQGPFKKINKALLMASDRQFLDESPNTANYYQIKAYDLYGHTYQSFSALGQLLDEIPPSPPIGLQGTINEEGIVNLQWQPNKEADHMGYRVFRSNHKDGFYNQVTSYFTRDTFYSHKINMSTSSQMVYYKVIALDFRENYSDYSTFCELKRPDIIPPIAPIIKKIRPLEKGVYLQWILSSSKDIRAHELQRKEVSDTRWEALLEVKKDDQTNDFVDTTASFHQDYFYRLIAIDEAGLESSSKMITARPLDKGIRASIENFEVRVDQESGALQLSWKYPPEKDLYQFVLYRGEATQSLRTYKHILPDETPFQQAYKSYEFTDTKLKANTRYTYQMIAKYKGGGFSPLSNTIEIEY